MDKIGVGNRLLELRKYTGLSRISISQKSDIPVITIRTWEAGVTDIRLHNLEKYLNIFASLGFYASLEWVLSGVGSPPYAKPNEVQHLTTQRGGLVSLGNVIELLTITSNLFYCLDSDERILYLNTHWQSLLHAESRDVVRGVPFQDICSAEIYSICNTNYLRAMNGEKASFSYPIGKRYSKDAAEVGMLYLPITCHKDKTIGVFGFLSSNTIV